MRVGLLFPLLFFVGLIGACAPQGMYEWGAYEQKLYNYYKDPDALEALMKSLDTTIEKAEKDKRVPPGMYAEYGYLLMIKNQPGDAVTYFEKEKAAWPESTVLMDKMIVAATADEKKTSN